MGCSLKISENLIPSPRVRQSVQLEASLRSQTKRQFLQIAQSSLAYQIEKTFISQARLALRASRLCDRESLQFINLSVHCEWHDPSLAAFLHGLIMFLSDFYEGVRDRAEKASCETHYRIIAYVYRSVQGAQRAELYRCKLAKIANTIVKSL